MKRSLTFLLVLAVSAPASAGTFYLTGDVPTDAGGSTRRPWEILRYDTGMYSVALTLPTGTAVRGMHRVEDGAWLFSVETPSPLGAVTYGPRDVVRFDGTAYSSYFCGRSLTATPIPDGSGIDAVYQDPANVFQLMVSFDVPTTLGGVTYDPADIVRFQHNMPLNCSSWTVAGIELDASATVPPIPPSANVIAADRTGTRIVLSFDVPTTLGAATYLPGDLVAWDTATSTFALYESVVGWPASRASAVANLSFLPPFPGEVPSLSLGKAGGNLTLAWGASCSPGAQDYAIQQGTIGAWYSHAAIVCTDIPPALTEMIAMPAGSVYFLVVPLDANEEGRYGNATAGPIPPGALTCRAALSNATCP